MAPEEVEKPTETKPEEVAPVSAEATAGEPAAAAEHAATAAEPAAAVADPATVQEAKPPAPPVDPVKQMGDAAHQVSASVDKAMAGVAPQNRFALVLVVSIFLAWVGDILNGQVMKGVAVLIVAICLVLGSFVPFAILLTFPLLCLLHLVAAIDAIVIASRIAKGEKFGDWDFFWKPAPVV